MENAPVDSDTVGITFTSTAQTESIEENLLGSSDTICKNERSPKKTDSSQIKEKSKSKNDEQFQFFDSSKKITICDEKNLKITLDNKSTTKSPVTQKLNLQCANHHSLKLPGEKSGFKGNLKSLRDDNSFSVVMDNMQRKVKVRNKNKKKNEKSELFEVSEKEVENIKSPNETQMIEKQSESKLKTKSCIEGSSNKKEAKRKELKVSNQTSTLDASGANSEVKEKSPKSKIKKDVDKTGKKLHNYVFLKEKSLSLPGSLNCKLSDKSSSVERLNSVSQSNLTDKSLKIKKSPIAIPKTAAQEKKINQVDNCNNKHAIESNTNFHYKNSNEIVDKAVPDFDSHDNISFKIPETANSLEHKKITDHKISSNNLTNVSRKAVSQPQFVNMQCKNRNFQPFEKVEDVLILDFEGESEIDTESVRDFPVEESVVSEPMPTNSKSLNSKSAFDWFPRLSNLNPTNQTFIPSFDTIINVKNKPSDFGIPVYDGPLPWSGEKFSSDESDSDIDCSFKRRRIGSQSDDHNLEEPNSWEKTLTNDEQDVSSDRVTPVDSTLLLQTFNSNQFNNHLFTDFGNGSPCDKQPNLTSANIDASGKKSQITLDADISITNVFDAIKANCKNNNIEEALSIAKEYISISPSDIAKKDIVKVLLLSVMAFAKFQTKFVERETFENILSNILGLIFDYRLYDSEICSLIVKECIGFDITSYFAQNIFIFCKKQSIVLTQDSLSAYLSVLDSREVPIFEFLSLFEYMKEVCNYTLPKQLFCKILKLFTKKEKYFQIAMSDEFKKISSLLCSVNSNEVDCYNLQKFLECCIKHEHWNTIAEFFRAWVKKSVLSHCLYQSLAIPLEESGSSYEKFAAAVHDNVGNDLPMHHVSLLGQIGALLMMESFFGENQRSALKILHVLHKYNINYYEIQTPAYYLDSCETFIQSLDDPFEVFTFPYTVAFTAVDICLYFRRSKDAFEIFKSFAFFNPSEITNSKLKSYVTVRRFIYLMKLAQLFKGTEPLNRGMDVVRLLLNAAENDFALEDLVDFAKELEAVYNQYLIFILNSQLTKIVHELYQHSKGPLKDIFSIQPQVFRGLVVFFDRNNLENEAKKLFRSGCLKDIYYIEKPNVEDTSWCLTIVSSWTKNEIKFAIELYIEMLFPVLFLKHSKSDEEWFPVKINFQEDQEFSPAIYCLDEHSTHIEAAIKKTCAVLQSLDSDIVWLEDNEKKCLIVQAELFYNYWKKARSQEEPSPKYLKLPALNMKEKTIKNPVIEKLPQTNAFKIRDEVTPSENSTEKRGLEGKKTSPCKDSPIPLMRATKRTLSSEPLREFSLSLTPPKSDRDPSPRKRNSPQTLHYTTKNVETDNGDQHNVICNFENKKVTPTKSTNLVSENKRKSSDTSAAALVIRNKNLTEQDAVSTLSSSTNICPSSSIETTTFTIAQLNSVDNQIACVPNERKSIESKDDLTSIKIPQPKTVVPKTGINSTPKLFRKIKILKSKKIKATPNKKLKTIPKVPKTTLKRRNTTPKISLLNLNKKPKLLMNEKINIVFDGTRSISVASKQPSNISVTSQKTTVNVKPSNTSNFQLSNQEEFEKITHFLKTKILQKCKNLNPEDSHQRAMDLAKNFVKENNVQCKLDKKGMKLLFEFSDKNI